MNLTPKAIKADIGGSFGNTFTDAASTKASSTVSDDNYQAQACADIEREREYNDKIQALANTATTNSSAHKTDANTHIPDGSTDTTDGSTIKEPTEGERMALENYKSVVGTDTTIEAMSKTTKDVGYWSCLNLKVTYGSAINSQFKRAVKWSKVAYGIFTSLPDPLKDSFKQNWYVNQSIEFLKVRHTYKNHHAHATLTF